MPEGLIDELMWFDSSRTPTGVQVVSLDPARPIEARGIFALPVEVGPPGASLFEVPLAVDLDPDVTSQETVGACVVGTRRSSVSLRLVS